MAASLLSLHLHPTAEHRRCCPVKASSSSISAPAVAAPPLAMPPSSLEETFGRKGIRFTDSDGCDAVELSVRNGSSLRLRIADGHVISYKPKVYWKDDGCRELLHTVFPTGASPPSTAKGGIGVVLDVTPDSAGASPSRPSPWSVRGVDSDSLDAVQVELGSTACDGTVEITYVISLFPLSMSTAVIVQNNRSHPLNLTSAMLTHIKFTSRHGAGIEGLRGCPFSTHPPPSCRTAILSPAEALQPDPPGWLSFLSRDEPATGTWTVEPDMYTILAGKFSRVYAAPPAERTKRIYSTPPSKYTAIDQWSGLGFRVIRMGYEEIFVCSPGKSGRKYGSDGGGHFVCTGPATMLVPARLEPGEEWRGAQVIEHDNL